MIASVTSFEDSVLFSMAFGKTYLQMDPNLVSLRQLEPVSHIRKIQKT